jgi:polar amino acid transport system substrate-binding protein
MRFKSWCLSTVLYGAMLMGWGYACAQPAPIRIGAEDDWAPFSSVKDGKPHGMAVDLVKAIFTEAGLAVEIISLPYKRCLEETRLGRIAGCFDTLPDAQLRKDYLFHSSPLFSDPILILTRSDNPVVVMDLKALEGQKVIITHGYTYGDAFERNTAVKRVVAGHDISALRMLNAKRGDYALVYQRITNLLLRTEVQSLGGKIKPVGQLTHADLYIAFSRNYPEVGELMRRFDVAHARLLKNQTIQNIDRQWK